ncbi:MAG: GrpB family protein [Candidatus Aegiribacteria sp.]|nr:GrpB family protein [Candidatus Aegiribacteria sp.]
MKIGLRRQTVRVVDHDPGWADLFTAECKILLSALDGLIVDVQHVGSTAVPDLPAKPVLDIAIAVQTLNLLRALKEQLTGVGYIYRGDGGNDGGHLFIRESSPDVRAVHLHVVERSDSQWKNYLLFRDTLRNDAAVRRKYADFKKDLAWKFPDDRESYTSGKNEFIQGVLKGKG